jgi:hypothetical protein
MLQKVFYLSLYARGMYVGRRRKQNVKTGPVNEKECHNCGATNWNSVEKLMMWNREAIFIAIEGCVNIKRTVSHNVRHLGISEGKETQEKKR